MVHIDTLEQAISQIRREIVALMHPPEPSPSAAPAEDEPAQKHEEKPDKAPNNSHDKALLRGDIPLAKSAK